MKRYFKATDGKITVFRASATKVYRSACTSSHFGIMFSGTEAHFGDHTWVPVEEITKGEYETLLARKVERQKCEGVRGSLANSPQQSWVRNAAVEG